MGTSQHTVQPLELLFGSHNIGTVFHRYTTALIPALASSSGLDSRPVESTTDPQVGYPRALICAPPFGEQIPPVISSGNVSIPHSLGSTLGEAQDRCGINRASGVPNVTSQTLDQSFLGISGVISVPTIPLEQGGINSIVEETLLEEVIPGDGPMSGGIRIAILGKNFPNNIPLYARFGNNLAKAVSHARYESTYTNLGPKNIYCRRGETSIHYTAVSLGHLIQGR